MCADCVLLRVISSSKPEALHISQLPTAMLAPPPWFTFRQAVLWHFHSTAPLEFCISKMLSVVSRILLVLHVANRNIRHHA